MTTQARAPRGIPSGGQFAYDSKAESNLMLYTHAVDPRTLGPERVGFARTVLRELMASRSSDDTERVARLRQAFGSDRHVEAALDKVGTLDVGQEHQFGDRLVDALDEVAHDAAQRDVPAPGDAMYPDWSNWDVDPERPVED